MCVSRTTINFMVTAYFIAYSVAGIFMFAVPDQWGSKKVMAVFGTLHLFAQYAIIFVPNYTVRLLGFGIMGACQLKNSVSYMWLFGLIQRKHTSISCGILNSWDTLTLSVIAVYYTFISNNWFGLMLSMTILGTVGNVIMLFMPESPGWLLQHGRK